MEQELNRRELERYLERVTDRWPVQRALLAGARVDDDEWAARRVDLNARWRNDARQRVIDRTGKCPAIDDKLDRVVENMRGRFG